MQEGLIQPGDVREVNGHTLMAIDVYPEILNRQAVQDMDDKIAQLHHMIELAKREGLSVESGNVRYMPRWIRDPMIPYDEGCGLTTSHIPDNMRDLFLKNFVANREYMEDEKGLDDLKGSCEGKHAFIIGSGFSLNRNGGFIEKLNKEKAVTISINGAGPAVATDYWMVIDPAAPATGWTPKSKDTVPLFAAVASDVLARRIVAQGFKPRWFRYNYRGPVNDIVTNRMPHLTGFDEGTNATFIAIQVAIYLGCTNIYFVGHDFALTHGWKHWNEVGEAIYGNTNVTKVKPVPDIYDKWTVTNEDYLKDLKFCIALCDLLMSKYSINFFNCSEEGCFNAPGIIEQPCLKAVVDEINDKRDSGGDTGTTAGVSEAVESSVE